MYTQIASPGIHLEADIPEANTVLPPQRSVQAFYILASQPSKRMVDIHSPFLSFIAEQEIWCVEILVSSLTSCIQKQLC